MSSKKITFIPVITFFLCLVSIAVTVNTDLSSLFIYNRSEINQGQLWRLISGHFVHYSTFHLLFNLICLFFAGIIVEKHSPVDLVGVVGLCSVTISVVLYFSAPQMAFYAGLSAIGYGLLVYCALLALRNSYYKGLGQWLLIILVLRIGFGLLTANNNEASSDSTGFVVMHSGHVTGCVTAVIYFYLKKTVLKPGSSPPLN